MTGIWDEDVEAETLAALIALRKSMQKHPIKHAVSFHSSVARAKAFAEYNTMFTSSLLRISGTVDDVPYLRKNSRPTLRSRMLRRVRRIGTVAWLLMPDV